MPLHSLPLNKGCDLLNYQVLALSKDKLKSHTSPFQPVIPKSNLKNKSLNGFSFLSSPDI